CWKLFGRAPSIPPLVGAGSRLGARQGVIMATDGGSVAVDSNTLEWRETPSAGVQWKKLHFDRERGDSAVLLKFEPGASYAAHEHPAGEEYLILEGTLEDGGRTYGAGTFVRHAPGSVHVPRSQDGCIVYVRLAEPIREVS
ncbi:MAG: cupin domain-containing protein, partial [Planctomycetota bacterium]